MVATRKIAMRSMVLAEVWTYFLKSRYEIGSCPEYGYGEAYNYFIVDISSGHRNIF